MVVKLILPLDANTKPGYKMPKGKTKEKMFDVDPKKDYTINFPPKYGGDDMIILVKGESQPVPEFFKQTLKSEGVI